jgi:hypothetical protein
LILDSPEYFGVKTLLEIFEGDFYSKVFIVGIIFSTLVQTSVASFFHFSDAYEGVRISKFAEKWSNFGLMALAGAALATMGNFAWHMSFTMGYLVLMLVLDLYVWTSCRRSSSGEELARMCSVLATRIDGVSVVGLGLLLTLIFFMGVMSAPTLAQILSVITQGICNGASCLPPGASSEAVLHFHFREVFVSGATGFQIIASSWLAALSLWEWQRRYANNGRTWRPSLPAQGRRNIGS